MGKFFYHFLICIFFTSTFLAKIESLYVIFLLVAHLAINIFVFHKSIDMRSDFHFPVTITFSLMNIISNYVALIVVPFTDFQCGPFYYKAIEITLFSNVIFYVFYFYFIKIIKHRKRHNTYKRISYLSSSNYNGFVLLLISFMPLQISNLSYTLKLFGLAFLLTNFFRNKNNVIDNVLMSSVILYLFYDAVVSTLIYNIIFLYVYLMVVFMLTGFENKKKRTLVFAFSFFVILFAVSFSSVKMDFRNSEEILDSRNLETVYVQMNSSDNNASNNLTHTFWRLSYPESALSHVLLMTPTEVPYWNGSSYLPIFFKLIPRFLYPNKPKEEMGQNFGHKYKLIADDNFHTSMNAPIIAEGYFNFGLIGIVIVSIFMAFFFSMFFLRSTLCYGKTYNIHPIDVFTISSMAVLSIQWESNFSMLFGKLIIVGAMRFIVTEFLKLRKL